MKNGITITARRGIVSFVGLSVACTGLISPAHAAGASATVDSSTIAFGTFNGDASVRSVQADGITVGGKPVVRYVRNPATHWSPRAAKNVPYAKDYWAGVASGKPFRLKKDQLFPDTYIGMSEDMTEHDVAVRNKVRHAWQLFDFKDGVVRNRGFWTGTRWVGDCVNPKPSQTPTIDVTAVQVVKQRSEMNVKIMGSISLWATTSGMVEVDCGTSRARAQYSALAKAEIIDGEVFIKATTRQEALIKGAQALKAKYTQSQEADLALRESAKLELAGSATAECQSDEVAYQAPTASGHAQACVKPGQSNGIITASGTNPNNVAAPGTLTVGGKTQQFASVGAGQTVSFDFTGFAPGTYDGSFSLGTPVNTSVSFQVTVQPCPDNAPSMECQIPEHIFVGDDAMYADFLTFDADGDTIVYDQPVTTGPIDIVMVESSVVDGKKHLAVKFRARDGVVPAGSSQTATISVTAHAGGKATTCTGTTTVTNGRTGW